MTNNFFSDKVREIQDTAFANNESTEYKVITVRPGNKVAALLDVMTELNQDKLPLAKISDIISKSLARFAISRQEHIECISALLKVRNHDEKSALGLLEKQKIITYHYSFWFFEKIDNQP